MATFLVLTPPAAGPRDEKTRLVRDAFSWAGLVFPVFWLLWHRAWLAALLAFAVQLLGSALMAQPGLGAAGFALSAATSLLVALEGPSMVVSNLTRRGWRVDDVVSADDRDTAELIYFNEPDLEVAARRGRDLPVLPASASSGRDHQPMLGLVGFERGR